MSKLLSKYRKKSESIEIEFTLDNYILLPDSRIKCNIILIPKHDIKLGNNDQEIIIKLTQFEKCEYQHELKDDTSTKQRENLILQKSYFKHLPDIISKKIKFKDIEFSIPTTNNNILLPSFEFRKSEKSLFVRHLLTVEIPGLEIAESIGVIICKLPKIMYHDINKETQIFKDEKIDTFCGLNNAGKISYKISLKKLIFQPKEEIPINICVNSTDLTNINIETIEVILQKNIIIYGLILNTNEELIMNKKEFSKNEINKKISKFHPHLQFESKDIPELTEKEIEKYITFDENFLDRDDNRTQLNPSIKGNLFKCEYKIIFNIIFDNIYKKTINEEFNIDIYDIYNINQESIPNYLKHHFLINENDYFDIERSSNDNDKEKQNSDGFMIIDHEDFRSVFEGKK